MGSKSNDSNVMNTSSTFSLHDQKVVMTEKRAREE